MTIIARESWLNCDLNFKINVYWSNPLFMFCWHLFHEESERVEEDSFNFIAAAFIAGNNITYQVEVQEMLYEAKKRSLQAKRFVKRGEFANTDMLT